MQSVQLAASEIWVTLIFCVILILFRKELKQKKVTKMLLIACITRLVSDAISWAFDGVPGLFWGTVTRISNYVTFVSNDLVSLVFSVFIWNLVKDKDEKPGIILRAYWVLEMIEIGALTLNVYFGWFYAFDSSNGYSRGQYYQLTHIAPIAALLVVCWMLIKYHSKFSKNQKFLSWTYFILMALATAYEYMNFGLSLQTYAQTFSALMAFFVGEIELRQHLLLAQERLEQKNVALKAGEKQIEAALKAEEEKPEIISSIADAYKEQLAIFNALADDYENVFFVDLDKETARILKMDGYVVSGMEKRSKADYPYTETLGRYIDERVHPEDQEMLHAAIGMNNVRKALENSNEYVGTYRILIGEAIHYYQYKYIKLEDIDCIIAGFQNVDDIVENEKKQREELSLALTAAQQTNKAKTMFLNSMSHDIRTPMNAIIGFTALAQTHINNTEQVQDYLAKINTSSTHLLSLINDILDMSRIESGSVKLDEKSVHMPDLLHDLRTMIQGLINLMPDMNGIETVRRIRKVIGEDVPIIVLTAYDWTDFEKEAREAGVTAFVAKPIFMSELRSVLTQPVQTEVQLPEGIENNYDYSGMHVLLVEDNEMNREIATAILEETGMVIDCAEDGIEAVNIINEAPEDKYDLIFMDIQMPRMDGYTATREIRTLSNNKKANIPIVAMTANAFEEDRQKAFKCGMNGHIVKPFDMKIVAKTLNRIFKQS